MTPIKEMENQSHKEVIQHAQSHMGHKRQNRPKALYPDSWFSALCIVCLPLSSSVHSFIQSLSPCSLLQVGSKVENALRVSGPG